MRKIISLIILVTFLFTNTAYSSNLRVPVGQIKPERVEEVLADIKLRDFKSWLTYGQRWALRRAIYSKFKTTKSRQEALQVAYNIARKFSEENKYILGPAITPLARLARDIDEFRDACDYLATLNIKLDYLNRRSFQYIIGSRSAITRLSKLAKDVDEFKVICDYLLTLHRKLQHENAETNFISPAAEAAKNMDEFRLFINFAIKVVENKIRFYEQNLKSLMRKASRAAHNMAELEEICNYIMPRFVKMLDVNPEVKGVSVAHIRKALKVRKKYGDFKVVRSDYYKTVKKYRYEGTGEWEPGIDPNTPSWIVANYSDYEPREKQRAVPYYEEIISHSEMSILPLTNLSNLKLTPVLFLDKEVVKNPSGFGQVLKQLKANEGNIPVIVLTKETGKSIKLKLTGLDLTGVQLRTLRELGLKKSKLNKLMSPIANIDNLKCIPLTKPLCEKFKDLQKARDEVQAWV